jgi:hypothetical protein
MFPLTALVPTSISSEFTLMLIILEEEKERRGDKSFSPLPLFFLFPSSQFLVYA